MWFFFRFITWEQRKLGTLGETYAGLSDKSKEDFGHGKAEFVPYMNVFMNPIADVAMTEAIEIDDRQAKVKNGDIFFTTSSETPEEVGMSSVWLKNGSNIYLNSFCFGFRPSESINSYYLAYMLRSSGVRQKIVFLAQGISRYNISKKKMMEIEVPMPICAEQRQLGGIFKQLDNLITLHQRKQNDKFSLFKPKNYANFLANSWEQRKFSELANTRRGLTYNPTNIVENGVRVLRSSNIKEDVFTLSEDDVFVCANAVNIEYVHEHEILITAANGSTRLVGKHAIIIEILEKSAVHGGFMLIASAKLPFFLNASMSAPWYTKFINLFVAGGERCNWELKQKRFGWAECLCSVGGGTGANWRVFQTVRQPYHPSSA